MQVIVLITVRVAKWFVSYSKDCKHYLCYVDIFYILLIPQCNSLQYLGLLITDQVVDFQSNSLKVYVTKGLINISLEAI